MKRYSIGFWLFVIVCLWVLIWNIAPAQNVTMDRGKADTLRPKNDSQILFDRRVKIDSLNSGVAGLPVGSVRDSIRKSFDTTAILRTAVNRWAVDTTAVHRTAINRWAVDTTTAVRVSITKLDTGLTGAGGLDKFTKIVGSGGSIYIGGGGLGETGVSTQFNTALGSEALLNLTGSGAGGHNNTAIGKHSMRASVGSTGVSPATYNTAVGSRSLESLVNGFDNTAIGYKSLGLYNDNGGQNVAVGYLSGEQLISGFYNTIVGKEALSALDTGSNFTSIGSGTLANWNGTAGVGVANTALGSAALNKLRTGQSNTALGYLAGYELRNANNNVLIGHDVMSADTATGANVVIGVNAMGDYNTNVSEAKNTVIGFNSGRGIVTGAYNTIIGANVTGLSASLSNNIIISDGEGNKRIQSDASGNITFKNSVTLRISNIPPEGVYTGNVGDIFINTGGGSATTLYIKESGAGTNTGWVGK